MAPDEADLFLAAQRRRRRRDRLVALAVLGAAVLVALGFYLRRERTCWFKGPDRAVILHLADRDAISVSPTEIFGARLRPGTYDLTVEGAPDGLAQVRVPYVFSSTVVLPLTSDQCFVVADVEGLYAPEGSEISGNIWISRITRSGEAVSLPWHPLKPDDFEMDICRVPWSKRLLDSVWVVEMVSCRKGLTVAEAKQLLLERYTLCRLREPPTE